MKKSRRSPAKAAELRRLAEQRLREQKTEAAKPGTEQDTLRLLHELQVHQVELEMQNEELMAARSEIEAGLERYTDLYDFAPVGYFTLDQDGTIGQVNITGAALLGVERSRLVRRRLGHFVAPDESGQWDQHLLSVLQVTKKQTCELTFSRADGSRFYARLESIRLDRPFQEAPPGDPSPAIRVAVSDISDRKRAEGALRQTADDLKRSNTELQQFAYVVGHDLQEPLRTVAGFLQLLRDRGKETLDAKAQEYLNYSVDGANRMSEMITDILDYYRVGSRGIGLAPVDFAHIVSSARASLGTLIRESQAVITHDPLPTVTADAGQMKRVFQNLIGNAVKFSAEGRRPKVHIGVRKENGGWIFTVKDNGIGIDPKQADRLFVLFQRLHTWDKYPGSGIGLAVCKRIVERHGGRIWIESKAGEGSMFHFMLPETKA